MHRPSWRDAPSKLLGEGEFPGGSLNVDVKNNVVTLRGTVATKADKAKAEQISC